MRQPSDDGGVNITKGEWIRGYLSSMIRDSDRLTSVTCRQSRIKGAKREVPVSKRSISSGSMSLCDIFNSMYFV